MRTFFVSLLLLIACSASAQITKLYSGGGDSCLATGQWQKFTLPRSGVSISGLMVSHEGLTGNVFVAIDDTISGKRLKVGAGRTVSLDGIAAQQIYIRTDGATIPCLLWYWQVQ